MKKKKEMKIDSSFLPEEVKKSMFSVGLIMLSNVFLLNICSFSGCYDINITNIFRLNLFCNGCTDLSYHLQKYQLQIYYAVGGYSLIKVNEMVHKYTLSKNLSGN